MILNFLHVAGSTTTPTGFRVLPDQPVTNPHPRDTHALILVHVHATMGGDTAGRRAPAEVVVEVFDGTTLVAEKNAYVTEARTREPFDRDAALAVTIPPGQTRVVRVTVTKRPHTDGIVTAGTLSTTAGSVTMGVPDRNYTQVVLP